MSAEAFACPVCPASELEIFDVNRLPVRVCPTCRGCLIAIRRLSEFVQTPHVVKIASATEANAPVGKRPCPGCARPMRTTELANRVGRYELDVCRNCDEVWFDTDELAQAPVTPEVVVQTGRLMNLPTVALDALVGSRGLRTTKADAAAGLVVSAVHVIVFFILAALLPDLPNERPDPLRKKKEER